MSGPLPDFLTPLTVPASWVYGLIIAARNRRYDRPGNVKSVAVPVISVGNITTGGTGKTPFAIMLSERLAARGKNPAVLTRGYGDDEWKMMKNVFVGRDRVKSARKARENGSDILILDDGFQHRRLRRGLDIVLVDSTNPFGNARLFPRGILREPLGTLARADFIVLTKVDKAGYAVSRVENEIKKIAPQKTFIKAIHKAKGFCNVKSGKAEDISFLKGKKVCALSAICDPSYFRFTLERLGAAIGLEFIYPDHYSYKDSDIKHISEKCKAANIDIIVTTEKDAVKLKALSSISAGGGVFVLEVELEIT